MNWYPVSDIIAILHEPELKNTRGFYSYLIKKKLKWIIINYCFQLSTTLFNILLFLKECTRILKKRKFCFWHKRETCVFSKYIKYILSFFIYLLHYEQIKNVFLRKAASCWSCYWNKLLLKILVQNPLNFFSSTKRIILK